MRLTVNGERVEVDVPARWTLVDVLRERLGLTGTNVGCEQGICGACTVLVDGLPARSCLVLAGQADGATVDTVEGLGVDGAPHALQIAFSQQRGLQCGFCTPGFLMVAAGLARERGHPTADEIEQAVSSNLCRCTGYSGIRAAFHEVLGGRRIDERPGAAAEPPPVS